MEPEFVDRGAALVWNRLVSASGGRSRSIMMTMLTFELVTPFACNSNGQSRIHSAVSENLPPCLFWESSHSGRMPFLNRW